MTQNAIDDPELLESSSIRALLVLVGIWEGIILGFTFSIIDSSVIDTQNGHTILTIGGYINGTLVGTTDPFGRYFILLGRQVQACISAVLFSELVLILVLLACVWVTFKRGTANERYHPRNILFYLFFGALLTLLYLPFVIRSETISTIYFQVSPTGSGFALPSASISENTYVTLVNIATSSAGMTIFSTYFVQMSKLISIIGTLLVTLYAQPQRRSLKYLSILVPLVADIILFYPSLTSIYTPIPFYVVNQSLVWWVDYLYVVLGSASIVLWFAAFFLQQGYFTSRAERNRLRNRRGN